MVLGFAAFVAARVFRETHRRQMETFERAVKSAVEETEPAGSEFQAMMGSAERVPPPSRRRHPPPGGVGRRELGLNQGRSDANAFRGDARDARRVRRATRETRATRS